MIKIVSPMLITGARLPHTQMEALSLGWCSRETTANIFTGASSVYTDLSSTGTTPGHPVPVFRGPDRQCQASPLVWQMTFLDSHAS